MKTHAYHHKFNAEAIYKLRNLIGLRLYCFYSIANKVLFSTNSTKTTTFSAFDDVTIVFLDQRDVYTCLLAGKPLGDTYIGDNTSELQLIMNLVPIKMEKWHSESIENSERVSLFNISGEISAIKTYGYKINTQRNVKEDLTISVEADTDLMLVFETTSNLLVVIQGNGTIKGVVVRIFPPEAHHIFKNNFLDRKNHWGENLYTLRQTIS